MKLTKKLNRGILALGLAGTMGVWVAGSLIGETYRTEDCNTYQGYNNAGANRIHVFDPQTLRERGKKPERALWGPSLELEIGGKYKLEIKDPIFGPERLVSTEKCEE